MQLGMATLHMQSAAADWYGQFATDAVLAVMPCADLDNMLCCGPCVLAGLQKGVMRYTALLNLPSFSQLHPRCN